MIGNDLPRNLTYLLRNTKSNNYTMKRSTIIQSYRCSF